MTVTVNGQRPQSLYFDTYVVENGGSSTVPLYLYVPGSMVVWQGICIRCGLLPIFLASCVKCSQVELV